ncbi:hypothetical protein HDU91_004235, partial [Kappamyces sp. JEL0680]
ARITERLDMTKELRKLAVDVKICAPAPAEAKPKKLEFDAAKDRALDYRNIVKNNDDEKKKRQLGLLYKSTARVGNITEQPHLQSSIVPDDFVDDPDVPPLC